MTLPDLATVLAAVQGFLARTTWPEALGYAGAVLSIVASSMRTMIPLRAMGVATNCLMLTYGTLMGLAPTILVNGVLLPLNAVRLVQMMRLVRKVRRAASSDLSMDWLKPFMTRRAVEAGEVLFAKGETAECLYCTLSGRYQLRETGIEIPRGHLVGEMGYLAPDHARTQTLECLEAGEVLTMSYDSLRELYFQNPEFGFYFLRLTSGRLFENVARLEGELARRAEAGQAVAAGRAA